MNVRIKGAAIIVLGAIAFGCCVSSSLLADDSAKSGAATFGLHRNSGASSTPTDGVQSYDGRISNFDSLGQATEDQWPIIQSFGAPTPRGPGACTGGVVYSSTAAFAAGAGIRMGNTSNAPISIADDVEIINATNRSLCKISVMMATTAVFPAAGTYTLTCDVYGNSCPFPTGTPLATQVMTGIPSGAQTVVFNFNGPLIPDRRPGNLPACTDDFPPVNQDLWVKLSVSATSTPREVVWVVHSCTGSNGFFPEIGCSVDTYGASEGGAGAACVYWFGGCAANPPGTFLMIIETGSTATTGACCNHVTGACNPNGTAANCTGANEILYLGQTCAQVNCPTGGCNPNPCPATLCPSGTHVNETEACGQNTNGCDTPQDIACGDTVCGTAWRRDAVMQDVDWYRFTTSGPAIVRLTATAEFPVQVSLVNIGASSCGTPTVIGSATANACTPAVFTSSCFSNSTELYARITVNGGVNLCGCNNDYTLKVECLPCTGSCCAIPGTGSCYKNCLDGLTQAQCTALGNQWIWGLNSTCFAATNGDQCGLVRTDVDCCKGDLNGDGTVNGLDIREFLKLFLSIETCFDNPDKFCRADYNNDNQITVADIGTSSTRFVKDLLDTKICYVQCSSTCGSPPANSAHERFEQPCGADGNGGCNLTPALFEPLPAWPFGTTISFCGSANTFDSDPNNPPTPESRDTDWWGPFTLNQVAQVTLSIKSADPNGVGTFLVQLGAGGSCTGIAAVGGVAFTTSCSTAANTLTALLNPGSYVIFVGNMTSTGGLPTLHSPCASTNAYTVTATSSPPPTGACCSGASVSDCTNNVLQADCVGFGATWHAGMTCAQVGNCPVLDCGTGTLTQNSSQTVTAGTGIACSDQVDTALNAYARCFSSASVSAAVPGRVIKCVGIGIEGGSSVDVVAQLRFDSVPGGTCPLPTNNGGFGLPGVAGTVQLGATINVTIPANFPAGLLNVDIPDITLPAGRDLVVEFQIPDTGTGGGIWPGSNASSETAPHYLASADCGATNYATLAALGVPVANQTHWVLVLKGS